MSKRHKTTHSQVSLVEIQSLIENVHQHAQTERASPEVMSSSVYNVHEHTGTYQDCSEGSGSPTNQDIPTHLSLAKRREARGNQREQITSRYLASAVDFA